MANADHGVGESKERQLPKQREQRKRRPEPFLKALFGDPMPEREAAMWALLDESQRAKALQRGKALLRWNDGASELTAKQAAADAGVSLVRFYQMNTLWRENRSLAALGVGAAPERERRSQFSPEVNAVLQSVVADIARDSDASVRSLALRLGAAALDLGVSPDQLPGHNTLRTIVERARRDRLRENEVGNALLLDHAACGLKQPDGAPWTVFVIADAASQLILGAAPGEATVAAQGYSEAARDAMRRIHDPSFAALPWAERLSRMQVVPGGGTWDAFSNIIAEAAAIGVGLNLTADRKAGRYLEQVVGRAIGVLPIWPHRIAVSSLPDWAAARAPAFDTEKARARISLAVDDHNLQLVARSKGANGRPPPPELTRLLEIISRN